MDGAGGGGQRRPAEVGHVISKVHGEKLQRNQKSRG